MVRNQLPQSSGFSRNLSAKFVICVINTVTYAISRNGLVVESLIASSRLSIETGDRSRIFDQAIEANPAWPSLSG